MSSTYTILCLNHDPAITVMVEDLDSSQAIARATDPGDYEQMADHAKCDLLVARYSGGLVELGCPGGEVHTVYKIPGYHHMPQWAEAGWLRLLRLAHERGDDVSRLRLPQCWTRERVMRLGHLLGFGEGA